MSEGTAASRDLVLQLFMPSEGLFHAHLLYCLLAPKEDFSTLAANKLQNFPLGPSHVAAISPRCVRQLAAPFCLAGSEKPDQVDPGKKHNLL